ncbi:MAG: HAD-IIIA family hydrolase [Ignavibacteria bacterium]|nr:HAD-IIIA family hydrolase [Ignavibacteria bacterium]
MSRNPELPRKARRVRMILLDVDGVMTDGGIYYAPDGAELKRFNAQDGYGIRRAKEHGLMVGIISGRDVPAVDVRARHLQLDEVLQGASDKVSAFREIQRRRSLEDQECAFMGDDLFDLPLLRLVGLSAAPRNAVHEVRRSVDMVTRRDGGQGAIRELIDFIIRCRPDQRRNEYLSP